MSLRDVDAKYSYGVSRLRFRALNDDLSVATASNVIGGAGPFDFSSLTATITSIPINLKVNDGAVVEETFDLTAAVDKGAVTVDECVTALTAAAITGWTFSKDASTGRLKAVCSTSGADVQVYGAGARLMKIGQGKGLKYIKSDTIQSVAFAPVVKEDVTKTVTDASDKDTEVIISGYKKGLTVTVTDTADDDYELLELIEGGSISTDGFGYDDPTSATKKIMFQIELYNPIYSKGTNQDDQIIKWEKNEVKMCKGSVGDVSKTSEFTTPVYNITAVNYKPRVTGAVESGARVRYLVDVEDWNPEMFDAV